MLRTPISKRIESGASLEATIAPKGVKLLLTSSDKSNADNQRPPAESLVIKKPLPDAKLLYLIPTQRPSRFQTVELPKRQPLKLYQSPSAPTGAIFIHQTPFYLQPIGDESGKLLGHHAIDIAPTDNNMEADEQVYAGVNDVVAIHFLLSAGNGWISVDGIQYMGRRIGYIELIFGDTSSQIVNLILGENIREWAFGNSTNLVIDIEYGQTKPAWVSFDNTRRIDIMSVAIDRGPKDLEVIRVVAQLDIGRLEKPLPLPAIIISAITCERKV